MAYPAGDHAAWRGAHERDSPGPVPGDAAPRHRRPRPGSGPRSQGPSRDEGLRHARQGRRDPDDAGHRDRLCDRRRLAHPHAAARHGWHRDPEGRRRRAGPREVRPGRHGRRQSRSGAGARVPARWLRVRSPDGRGGWRSHRQGPVHRGVGWPDRPVHGDGHRGERRQAPGHAADARRQDLQGEGRSQIQLDKLQVGDRLLATYVEAVAIKLEKKAKKR